MKRYSFLNTATVFIVSIFAVSVHAQDTDDLDFFTDSDVRKSILGVEGIFTPNITNANVLEELPLILGDDTTLISTNNRAGFGMDYGVGAMLSPNGSLDFRVGIRRGVYQFNYDAVELVDENASETELSDGSVRVIYLNVPIQMAFHQRVGDFLELEYGLGVIFNFLQSYEFEMRDVIALDRTELANPNNLTLAVHLGANIVLNDRLSIPFTPNFRYLFQTLVPTGSQNSEALYTLGFTTGIRYRL